MTAARSASSATCTPPSPAMWSRPCPAPSRAIRWSAGCWRRYGPVARGVLARPGAWREKEAGLLSTIVLEMGGSSDLCAQLKPGEPVILMGPTGTPTETPADETVLLVGGGP